MTLSFLVEVLDLLLMVYIRLLLLP
jgi:hypothetical protein